MAERSCVGHLRGRSVRRDGSCGGCNIAIRPLLFKPLCFPFPAMLKTMGLRVLITTRIIVSKGMELNLLETNNYLDPLQIVILTT